ncbi:MAG: TPR-like protein [Monoraphidium minutum]|nr:MAG: TPR-like protein [Monoraphidium minutum]
MLGFGAVTPDLPQAVTRHGSQARFDDAEFAAVSAAVQLLAAMQATPSVAPFVALPLSAAGAMVVPGGGAAPAVGASGALGAPAGHMAHAQAAELEQLLAEAHEAYRGGDYARALSLCQPVHAAAPGRVDALLLMGAAHYQLRSYEECVAANDRAILLDPTLAEAHANLANALQQLGNMDMAIVYYQSALRLKPYFTDAYNNMASALVHKGLIPAAMDCYAAALRINPGLVDVHNNLGDLWRAQGPAGRAAAQQCYGEALRLDPRYAPAWRGLGDLLREAGDAGQALACYQEAARLRPNYVDALTGMGVALKELRRRPEAEAAFEAVVKLRPACALSLGNLAGIYYEQGKLEAAIATYRAALGAEPNFPEAYNNLGNALREAGRADEAAACYTACIRQQYARAGAAAAAALGGGGGGGGGGGVPAIAQRLSVAYNNLGGLLKMTGQAAAAIACYEQVSLLQPESPEAAANLGSSYKDAARHDAAISAYRRALGLRPDFPEAFANLMHSLQCVCEWAERPALFARLEGDVRRDLAAGRLPAVQPFHAMAYPFPADLALAISRAYAEQCALAAARLGLPALPHPPARPLAPGRAQRLRVAYVSSDFGNHPLSHLMGSVFGLHDRRRVEVFCYALSPPDGSEWRRRIEAEAEHFIDASAWPAADVAGRISADGVHVAINLNGYTKGARNEIFALRPAPVQASYMGFPATTGAPFLPYLITDGVVAPRHLHHCYSESLALMPHCYFVNDYARCHRDVLDKATLPRRADFGLPPDRVVYCCSNQLYKYDPDTFSSWCAILRRVPDSVLWLLRFPPYGEANLRAAAAARGVDPGRLVFTDVAAKDVHIRRSGLADVFLDTPLCNAHTTGCDVLWGGCPMVTLPLERMASRVAASLAAATGLGREMVVASHAEYEDRAVELGLDGAKRAALRGRLEAARLSCPLFDTGRWVRDLERVLFRMWDIHCEGGGPRTFEITD